MKQRDGILGSLLLLMLPIEAENLQVPAAYRQVAHEVGVPAKLLFAIALTESGRLNAHGSFLPYPWALNLNGEAYYFANRAEADGRLAKLLDEGHRPDIGLMQVNWRYHQPKLGEPAQAFDPWLNLRAGAMVLHNAFQETGDWWQAVGRYHSRTPERARAYRARVRRWFGRLG